MYGNIVGIVNIKLIYGSQIDNLGFAISIDEAMPVIAELVNYGLVRSRAMLGITALQVTPQNATSSVTSGLYVTSVSPDTPAAVSGLSYGDIITHLEGEEVKSVSDIQVILRDKNPGDMVELTVIRRNNLGESSTVTIKFELTSANPTR
jgi:serine protease Do